MSEYQYYEFQAVDQPLDKQDIEALRALSTRARVTATSFTNHYEWGNFRGDPLRLMERWFDLHLYLANWGSRRLCLPTFVFWPKKTTRWKRIRSVISLSALGMHARPGLSSD